MQGSMRLLQAKLRIQFANNGMREAFYSMVLICRNSRGKEKLIQCRTVNNCSMGVFVVGVGVMIVCSCGSRQVWMDEKRPLLQLAHADAAPATNMNKQQMMTIRRFICSRQNYALWTAPFQEEVFRSLLPLSLQASTGLERLRC